MEGCKDRSGHIYVIYTYINICIHISQTYIDAEFDVESFGMVYLASKGCLNDRTSAPLELGSGAVTVFR